MFKKLLIAVGLAKAPSPLRRFVGAKAFFGTIPALAYVGWKYRDEIKGLLRGGERRLRALGGHGEREPVVQVNP